MNDLFEFIKKNWLLIVFIIFQIFCLTYFIRGFLNCIYG